MDKQNFLANTDVKNPEQIILKKTIASALFVLLKDRKISAIKINDLVNEAGFSRRTFYRYFKNKQDVLDCAISYLVEDYIDFESKSPYRSLHNISFIFFSYWQERSDIIHLLMDNNLTLKFVDELFDSVLVMLQTRENTIFGNVRSTYTDEKGVTRDITTYSLRFATGGFVRLLTHWIEEGATTPPRVMADIIVDFFNSAVEVRD